MNMKFGIIVVAAMAMFQFGCESTMPAQTIQPTQTVRTPTPRERAKEQGNRLWMQVKPFMAEHDYDTARKMVLSGLEKDDAEIADMMRLVRIGIVTSIINPAELEWRIEGLNKKIDDLCATGDFDSAYAAVEVERKHWNDMQFTNVDAVLGKVRNGLATLYYSDSAAKAFIEKYRNYIRILINNRSGMLLFRQSIDDTIKELEECLKKEMPDAHKNAVDELIKQMRSELRTRNLTTLELERKFMSMKKEKQGVIKKEKQGVIVEEATLTPVQKMLSDLQAKIAISQSLAGDVDLDDEIDTMERAARGNCFGRGLLFAECAHGLRTLLSANNSEQLDYQNLLSVGVLLGRRHLMDMALKCGADVKKAAPGDSSKKAPLALAVEVGSKNSVAWLCEKGARVQIAQMSFDVLKTTVVKNRLDMFKYLQKIGCTVTDKECQNLFMLCCKVGSDNLHEYLVSLGAEPNLEAFVKAIEVDNLVIVKWFVEQCNFNVNALGVSAAAKHPGVRAYLIRHGMQQ